jgi:predicted nucleic acid-binding Zn ribbon protein
MPTEYVFKCPSCTRSPFWTDLNSPPKCCGDIPMKRSYQAEGVKAVFKGSGWARTQSGN